MVHAVRIKIRSVGRFDALDIARLVSLANSVQEFALFELGEKVVAARNEDGQYSHQEVMLSLMDRSGTRTASTRLNFSGQIVVSSADIDFGAGTSLEVDPYYLAAVVTEFRWRRGKNDLEDPVRWLYILIGLAAMFLRGEQCTSEGCLCNSCGGLSLTSLQVTHLCGLCKRSLAEYPGIDMLMSVEAALAQVKRIAASLPYIGSLDEVEAKPATFAHSHEYQLVVDESWVRDWLARNLSLGDSLTRPMPLLPASICNSVMSIGTRPGWAEPVLASVERSRPVDTLLYLTGKRHRDHSRHQFYVATIGMFMLDSSIGNGQSLGDCLLQKLTSKYSSRQGFHTISMSSVYHSWVVAACLHDSGYPLSYMLDVVSNICQEETASSTVDFHLIELVLEKSGFFAKKWFGLVRKLRRDVTDGVRTSYDALTADFLGMLRQSFERCFGSLPCTGYRDGLPRGIAKVLEAAESKKELVFDHGLWSAVNIVELLEESKLVFPCSPLSVDATMLAESIEAMALHNMSRDYSEANFEDNPLTCLLRFCDEMQEWNRGTFARGKFIQETDHVVLGPYSVIEGVTYLSRNLRIRFEYPTGERLLMSDWDMRKFSESKMNLSTSDFPLKVSYEIGVPFGATK